MKDSRGTELKIGDEVGYVNGEHGRIYTNYVCGFTSKKIRIGSTNSYCTKFPEQVVKIGSAPGFTKVEEACFPNLDAVIKHRLLEDGTYFVTIKSIESAMGHSAFRSLLITVKDGIVNGTRMAEKASHFIEQAPGEETNITREINLYKLCKISQ